MRLLRRLRDLLHRRAVEQDLDDELRDHIAQQTALNIARGMRPDAARTAALAAFGGIEAHKETVRDARGFRLFDDTARDLAHSVRITRQHPGFALIVVLSLALGLGATTSVFHLTWRVLFARLPLPHPEQLVSLTRVSKDDRDNGFRWSEFQMLTASAPGAELSAGRSASQIAISAGDMREYVNMHFVDGRYFGVTGLAPFRGRFITPGDDSASAPVVVISRQLAARLFPGDAPVVGRAVNVGGAPFTVIGITPAGFHGLEYPGQFAAAIPLGAVQLLGQAGERADDRGQPMGVEDERRSTHRSFTIVARLPDPGLGSRAALGLAFEQCCATPNGRARERLELVDISRGIGGGKDDFRGTVGTVLIVLLAGTGLVLVVVCCNIAGLLLVRASARQRELAVRLSLGASRGRLLRQLILESMPLALAGGGFGLVLAGWMTTALVSRIPEWDAYLDVLRFRSDPAVLLFAALLTLGCGLCCAVFPALRATRQAPAASLRLDVRASRSRGQGAVARGVVVAQMSVTIVLVTAASLLALTLRNLTKVDAGFTTQGILLTQLEARGTGYENAGVVPLHEEILRRIQTAPGVLGAAMATMMPMFGGSNSWLLLDVPGVAPDQRPWVRMNAVTPGFFETAGIRLLSGRDLRPGEGGSGSEPVVIVSQAMVEKYFGGKDPVGRSLSEAVNDKTLRSLRIIGVVADVMYSNLRSQPEPWLYLPLGQLGERQASVQVTIRTDGDPARVLPAVRQAVESAAPGLRVRRTSTMVTQRAMAAALERLAAQLATFVSAMALVLSVIGLYGVVAYSVARRTSELGIRMALGARGRAIVWLVLRQSLGYVALGVAIGLPLSYAANAALRSQLFGVGAHDPFIATGAVLVLSVAALLAGFFPARRAARIDPRIALSAD